MAPTNLLRSKACPAAAVASAGGPAAAATSDRVVVIKAGRIAIRARLAATATADRIWRALPIHSTAETWGECLHFETDVETGRDRSARHNVAKGQIAFWSEDDRVIIGYGATPLSRADEIRLPSPCNIWAEALDDVAALAAVRPGQAVSILVAR